MYHQNHNTGTTSKIVTKFRSHLLTKQEENKFRKHLLSVSSEFFISLSAVESLKIEIHKTVILPVVLYGRETRSVALREEQ
jgi:hypothetical protein